MADTTRAPSSRTTTTLTHIYRRYRHERRGTHKTKENTPRVYTLNAQRCLHFKLIHAAKVKFVIPTLSSMPL